eukprot:gene2911-3724_t
MTDEPHISALKFWALQHPCNNTLPVMSDSEKRINVTIPPHGTAVVTITHRLHAKQQHTFHRYYSRAIGAENVFFGVHMRGGCEWSGRCDIGSIQTNYQFTPMMKRMAARGSKLIAVMCAQDNSTTESVNQIVHDLREFGYRKVIYVEDDEFLVPDPHKYSGGLLEYVTNLSSVSTRTGKPWRRAHAYDVRQSDEEWGQLHRGRAILHQRSDPDNCNVVLSETPGRYDVVPNATVPAIQWQPLHSELQRRYGTETPMKCNVNADPELAVIRLRCADRDEFRDQQFREYSMERRQANRTFTNQTGKEFRTIFAQAWNQSKDFHLHLSECGYSSNNRFEVDVGDKTIKYSRNLARIPAKWVDKADI